MYIGEAWLNGCDSESLMRLQLRCQLGLQPSKVLAGAGESSSKVSHSHGWQVCSSPLRILLVAPCVSSCHGAWFLSEPKIQKTKAEAKMSLTAWPQKSHTSTVAHILYVHTEQLWVNIGKDYTRAKIIAGPLGDWLPQPYCQKNWELILKIHMQQDY